jgi:hypothetical protein
VVAGALDSPRRRRGARFHGRVAGGAFGQAGNTEGIFGAMKLIAARLCSPYALRIPTFQFHASNSQPTLAPTAVPARLHICRRQFGLILAFRSVAFHLAGACGRRNGCRRRSGYGRRGGWRGGCGWRGSCGWRSRRGGILVRSAAGQRSQPEQQRNNDLQFKDFPLAPHRQPPPPFRPNVTACPCGRKGACGKLVTFLLTASAGMAPRCRCPAALRHRPPGQARW